MEKRICTVCKVEKTFDEFYKSKKGKYGISERCKSCRLIEGRIYYANNKKICHDKHTRWVRKHKKHVNEKRRAYYAKNPEIQKQRSKEYRKRTRNASIKKYKKKHPQKLACHRYVEIAIKFGHLIRPICCDFCKKSCKTQAHHKDYKKPLEVEWLCTQCHGLQHRIL